MNNFPASRATVAPESPTRLLARVAAVGLALVLALLIGPGPVGANSKIAYDPDLRIRFEGVGNGHGVGMSQWGAYGRALAGQRADEIIHAYYTDVAIEQRNLDEQEIRVLVSSGYRAPAVDASYAGTGGLRGQIFAWGGPWEIAGLTVPIEAGGRIELLSYPGEAKYLVQVFNSGNVQLSQFEMYRWIRIRPLSPATTFQVWYKETAPVPGGAGAIYYDVYRGGLRLIVRGDGTVDTVNEVPIEQYLRGVVPVEVVHDWPIEAIKAQAMAARTFALDRIAGGGVDWDTGDTVFSQAYLGANAEQENTDLAVSDTRGLVITHAGLPINALYFSSFGGRTENSEEVFGGAEPWLRSRSDLDENGQPFDAVGPWGSWSTPEFPMSQLAQAFAQKSNTDVGELVAVDFSDRSSSGAVRNVTITGSLREIVVTGEFFIQVFNVRTARSSGILYSHNFEAVLPDQPPPVVGPDPSPALGPTIPGGAYFYPQTGHWIGGPILDFYLGNGGVAAFGLPLTGQLPEHGRIVQYFEKARIELPPGPAAGPGGITLGLLSQELLGETEFVPDLRPLGEGDLRFAETGFSVRGVLRQFFTDNGGVFRFGYPISPSYQSGRLTVQHFQRATINFPSDREDLMAVTNVGSQLLQQRGWFGGLPA